MEDLDHCKRCGKRIGGTKNWHSITFGAWTTSQEMYFVCDSCYNKILRYILTRPINKES